MDTSEKHGRYAPVILAEARNSSGFGNITGIEMPSVGWRLFLTKPRLNSSGAEVE